MRHASAAAFVLCLASTNAFAAGVAVPIDEVRTVTFAKPVSTVYVGNPVIADINMIDSRHAFVLGKAYGTTNAIALDSNGRQISNIYISVAENRGALVTVFHGAGQQTMSCGGPRCEVSPTPGDQKYQPDLSDIGAHHSLGTSTATTASAQP
jgi:hypothetical protein